MKTEIEIEGRKYKLVGGCDCCECVFDGGVYCGLNHYPDIANLCNKCRGHWKEIEDED